MASLYFSKSYSQNADLGSLLVVIPPVNSKRMLLVELSQKLQFPDYFGFNWDALYDLLCECYGIKEKNKRGKENGFNDKKENHKSYEE